MNRQQRRAARRGRKQPTEKEMNALATQADEKGCASCGMYFAQGLPYFVQRVDGELQPRCGHCVDAPLEFAATYFGGGDPWAADDREWFAARPKRQLRLRELWPGELMASRVSLPPELRSEAALQRIADNGLRLVVMVYQITPGKRIRKFCGVPTDDPLDSFTDAGIKRMLNLDNPARLADEYGTDLEAAWRDQMERRASLTCEVLEMLGAQKKTLDETPAA